MKKFRFNYSLTVWILLAVVNLLFIGGLAYNIFNFIEYLSFDPQRAIPYLIAIILCLTMSVFSIALTAYGRYVIKGDGLYTYWGFIRRKTEIKEIESICHFKKSDKLVVYYKKAGYTVIVISPDKYDEFISTLRDKDKSIVYSHQIDGEETPNE